MPPLTPFSTLTLAIAQGARPPDLLAELHRGILAATGGTRAVTLERGQRSGDFSPPAGPDVDPVGGAWLTAAEAAVLGNGAPDGSPRLVALEPGSPLKERLQAERALIVPLAGPTSAAYLLISDPSIPDREAIELAERARVEFALALELVRLGGQAAFHQHVQELLLEFSRGISVTLGVAGALGSLCVDTNALFGTARVSVWLHDRRARELVMTASSDPGYAAGTRLPTDSTSHAARGLRIERPEMAGEAGDRVVVAPLRGWRRALGSVIFEGAPTRLTDQQFTEAAYDLARQLSAAIENVQLLEVVLQHRRLLEDTFNSIVDLVAVTDNELRVVQMNGTFAARVGLAQSAVFERPLSEFIGTEMGEWAAAPQPATETPDGADKGSRPTARTKVFSDDRLGGIFAATVTPLINANEHPVGRVLVARDITAQTGLEKDREALRERLAQSEKLASLGQFVAGIAHEMNNPLQGVLGHLELLLRTSEAARPIRATLRRIYQEADRAAKIVRNLLMFAGSQRLSLRTLRLERVLAKALASRAPARRREHIEVSRQVGADLPNIQGDGLLLQQAVLNILINAEHAIAHSGRPGRIDTSVTAANEGRSVRLTIRDTGDGFPPGVLPRIFDPFFTTKEVGQGTGLGLAITYGIIQEHRGTIAATNAAGGGAQFTIDLPAYRRERT